MTGSGANGSPQSGAARAGSARAGSSTEPPTVGLHSPQLVDGRSALFDALGTAFGVRFCPLADGRSVGGHGAVVLESPPPELMAAVSSAPIRALVFDPPDHDTRPATVADSEIQFGDDELLDRHIRGRRLSDRSVIGRPPLPFNGPGPGRCLASAAGLPVWTRQPGPGGGVDLVACPVPRLEPGQALRDLLSADRTAALIPLVQLLRELTTAAGWRSPPLRACFVLDDPNLRSMTYGRMDYRRELEQAQDRPFHISVASVPLDCRLTLRRSAAELFHGRQQLSIAVHGNNHTRGEWTRGASVEDYLTPLAVALRRMDRLVDRGLSYDRVQVAPHNRCSAEAATAMALLDYEGLTIPRSFRERTGLVDPVLTGGWLPADITPDGLPVLVRSHVDDDHQDYALRAFLGVPIVIYGHHWDFGPGTNAVLEAVDAINRLGEVQWRSLAEILRSNVATALHHDTVLVRPYSRRFTVDVPPGASRLRIDLHDDHPLAHDHRLIIDGVPTGPVSDGPVELPARTGRSTVEVRLEHRGLIHYESVPRSVPRPWPVVRRLLAEARDRTDLPRPSLGRSR